MIDGNPEKDGEKTSGQTQCSDGSEREAEHEVSRESTRSHERCVLSHPSLSLSSVESSLMPSLPSCRPLSHVEPCLMLIPLLCLAFSHVDPSLMSTPLSSLSRRVDMINMRERSTCERGRHDQHERVVDMINMREGST